MQKGSTHTILLVLVLIALLALVFLLVFRGDDDRVPTNGDATATPTNIPANAGDEDDSTNKVETQTITGESGLYSIEVPSDWTITRQEGAKGAMHSYLTVQSPNWSFTSDETVEGPCTPFTYDFGASLNIHVIDGNSEPVHRGEGGNVPPDVTGDMTVGGVTGIYHEYREFCATEGMNVDVHLDYNGGAYIIGLSYNPDNFDGVEQFNEIIETFQFLK